MAKVEILRVVVASPGDVQAERDLVPQVIEEVNRNVGSWTSWESARRSLNMPKLRVKLSSRLKTRMRSEEAARRMAEGQGIGNREWGVGNRERPNMKLNPQIAQNRKDKSRSLVARRLLGMTRKG